MQMQAIFIPTIYQLHPRYWDYRNYTWISETDREERLEAPWKWSSLISYLLDMPPQLLSN